MRSTEPFEDVVSDSEEYETIHDLRPVEMVVTRMEESPEGGTVSVEPIQHWPPELTISDA